MLLSKLGVRRIDIFDDDIIEAHNIPNQAFTINQLGKLKSLMLARNVVDFGSDTTEITPFANKIDSDNAEQFIKGDVCFCLVDTMKARKEIFDKVYKDTEVKYWIETRMGLTGYRIYLVDLNNDKEVDKYKETLYSDDDAEVSACGSSQSIVTTAMQCASHAVGLWLALKNGAEYVPNEVILDVHSSLLLTRKFDKKEGE